ncbi:MAG: hypothetical protein EBU80_02145 [Chitinophagia bacterium]|nr:hypothetical protein [Chitinophagia bacterium]
MQKGSFGYDLVFLKTHHKDLVLLEDSSSDSKLIVLPAYQGRIMTSTAEGLTGMSFGWINHELIASKQITPHIYAVGGEERFWLGPEGGQFSIYFKKDSAFDFEHWQVPKEIDTEPFELIAQSSTTASFKKVVHLKNYSGSSFDVGINRMIHLLNRDSLYQLIGDIDSSVRVVGFSSDNTITNLSNNTWDEKYGMLSIWILSMLNAGDETSIAIPYRSGSDIEFGRVVTDDYFGEVPSNRLKVTKDLILLKADAKYRSKIGISPKRAKPFAGSYDAKNNVLTIAFFSLPEGNQQYVNSLWEVQTDPFSGDAVNAYNDGPISGKQMGKFYEIESSSPGAALGPGESLSHQHTTIHLKGNKEQLEKISTKLFSVSLQEMIL